MKKYILALILFTVVGFAGQVVFYDPISSPITNRITRWAPIIDEVPYIGSTNALIITNRSAQSGPGVTLSNLFGWCIVDGTWVRLMSQTELDIIAATNAIIQSNALWQAKYDARDFATNVVNGSDGLSLYIRSMGEANWFLINQIRTNFGYPGITRGAYKTMIDTNINNFGQ